MKNILKCLILICLGLFSAINLSSQKPCSKEANLIGVYPISNEDVNGLRINFFPKFGFTSDGFGVVHYYKPRTNGVEVISNPLGLVYAIVRVPEYGRFFFGKPNRSLFDKEEIDHSTKTKNIRRINGICLSTMNLEMSEVNGIELSIGGSSRATINGIAISPLINSNIASRGLVIGVIGNHTEKLCGIQIGLLNSSTNTKGIQLGLWNKNEERSLPFVNWNF